VVGSNIHEISNILGDKVNYVIQDEPLGTGHAAMVAVDLLRGSSDQLVLMYGDMPFIQKQTVEKLIRYREQTGAAIAMVSMLGSPDSTFGRVIRDEQGTVAEVIEWADAKQRENASELLSIRELNAGLYCFDTVWFCENVSSIIPRPSRDCDEYYLTDIFRIAKDQGRLVVAMQAEDNNEFFGISTKADLDIAEAIFKQMLVNHADFKAPVDWKI